MDSSELQWLKVAIQKQLQPTLWTGQEGAAHGEFMAFEDLDVLPDDLGEWVSVVTSTAGGRRLLLPHAPAGMAQLNVHGLKKEEAMRLGC
jgi:hypothetical protein